MSKFVPNKLKPRKRLYKSLPSIYYFDRKTKSLRKEIVPAEKWLKWLYHDPIGNIALEAVIKRKALSKVYGKYMDTPISAAKIKSFIELFEIDMSESVTQKFSTFNDFFTRKLKAEKRPIDKNEDSIVSPADGKLFAFDNISSNQHFYIKGYDFSLSDFLGNSRLADYYNSGSMIIIRLVPSDYHRFHFPVDGMPEKTHLIRGKYYSVSPISVRKKIKTFYRNKREYTIIKNNTLGDVVMAEVGATLVGSIIQTYSPFSFVHKGDEKGYFKFGGSSVILLFEKNSIVIDEDLLYYSKHSYETAILMGEKIASVKSD